MLAKLVTYRRQEYTNYYECYYVHVACHYFVIQPNVLYTVPCTVLL